MNFIFRIIDFLEQMFMVDKAIELQFEINHKVYELITVFAPRFTYLRYCIIEHRINMVMTVIYFAMIFWALLSTLNKEELK